MRKYFYLLLIMLSFLGCVSPPPDEDLALAEAAVLAAKEAKADQLAPEWYQKAEEGLSRAKRAKEMKEFDLAKKLSQQSRGFAEKAEEISILKAEKGGGS